VLKVSVIVPVYNPGPNIDECIDSLLGQNVAIVIRPPGLTERYFHGIVSRLSDGRP